MERKWYQDWRSWLTIVLLFFVPTFLIGIIVMWAAAPWSKKAKWWVTGIGVGVPLLGIIASLLILTINPGKQILKANDVKRRADVQEITTDARHFCLDQGRCPSTLSELVQRGYLKSILIDPVTKAPYSYQLTSGGKDCLVKITLSTGEEFKDTCLSGSTP